MKKVMIHTDGGCHGNPGPGGWAVVLAHGPHTRVLSGAEPATTNNRMELTAAIEALRALREPCEVELFTDSEYLREGVTSWLPGWKANGWRTRKKTAVKNEDLWRALDTAAARHSITWKWLKGHAGHEHNEQCDRVARGEIAKLKQSLTPTQLHEALTRFNDREKADPGQHAFF